MDWIREAVNDSQTGKASAKRIAMLAATGALSLSVILLSIACLFGYPMYGELGAVAVPLAGLGGYSYVNGKATEIKRNEGAAP